MNYANKQQLLDEINKTAKLFIDEFSELSEAEKDKLIEGVDRTPAQMIAYQLGWLDLVKSWDDAELAGQTPVLPAEGYKWNQLGELYQHFYKIYQDYSLQELIQLFKQKLTIWNSWIESLDDNTLFTKDEKEQLLELKYVGDKIIERLQQMELDSFEKLRNSNLDEILNKGALLTGSSCWKNSHQAKTAIQNILAWVNQS